MDMKKSRQFGYIVLTTNIGIIDQERTSSMLPKVLFKAAIDCLLSNPISIRVLRLSNLVI